LPSVVVAALVAAAAYFRKMLLRAACAWRWQLMQCCCLCPDTLAPLPEPLGRPWPSDPPKTTQLPPTKPPSSSLDCVVIQLLCSCRRLRRWVYMCVCGTTHFFDTPS